MTTQKYFQSVTSRLSNRVAANDSTEHGRNLRTLQAQIDALARGEFASVLAQACDDVTLDVFAPPEFPFVRQARGAAAFRRAIEQNVASVIDQRPVIRDVFAEGERIVLFGRETGTIRATGQLYDLEFVHRYTFRDGRLAAAQVIAAHARHAAD